MAILQLLAGERQKGESGLMVQCCNDWLRLGPTRSLPKLLASWGDSPLTSSASLKRWSASFGWEKRGEAFDKAREDAKTARAKRIMETGTALPHERVRKLKKLEAFLEAQIYHEDPDRPDAFKNDLLWAKDVKIGGTGDNVTVRTIYRFNAPLIEQYRGVQDDLAKETGGRVKKAEIAGKDGGPITFMELMRMAAGEDEE